MAKNTIGELVKGLADEAGEMAALCDQLADGLTLTFGRWENKVWPAEAIQASQAYDKLVTRLGARCENCGKQRLDIVYAGEVWLCRPCAEALRKAERDDG